MNHLQLTPLRRSKRWLGLGLLFVLQGCSSAPMGGQTGGEVDTATCTERVEHVDDADATALGFSALDAAKNFATGETLKVAPNWLPPTDPTKVTYDVPGSETVLSFALTFEANEARFVRSEVNKSGSGPQTAVGMVEELCRDRLELPIRVLLATSTGELTEAFDATLRAFGLEEAEFDATLDPQNLNGRLEVSALDPKVESIDLYLVLKLSPGTAPPEGRLEVRWSAVDDQNASFTSSTFATW